MKALPGQGRRRRRRRRFDGHGLGTGSTVGGGSLRGSPATAGGAGRGARNFGVAGSTEAR